MKLDINDRKKNGEITNTWKLNDMLLKTQQVNEEIKEEIRKYLETNENGKTTSQNLWDVAEAVQRRKFIAIQAFLKKQEKSQINNLSCHLKELEKEQTIQQKLTHHYKQLYSNKDVKKKEQSPSQQNEGNNKDQRGNK